MKCKLGECYFLGLRELLCATLLVISRAYHWLTFKKYFATIHLP